VNSKHRLQIDIWQFDISPKQKSEPFLRQVLAYYLPEKNLQIERGEFGKPFLPDFPKWQFNASHSGEKMLIAVSFEMPVGIDVEQIKQRKSLESLVKKCFSQVEQNYWFALPETEKIAVFYDFWTRKEAVVKGIGRGIAIGLERCEIDVNSTNQFSNLPIAEKWFTQKIAISSDYCAAISTPCANVILKFCDLEK
jgi:4'-phosphopantetheinyl transferase